MFVSCLPTYLGVGRNDYKIVLNVVGMNPMQFNYMHLISSSHRNNLVVYIALD